MMKNEGYAVNHKRVYRIWCEDGLKVPKKKPKRARLRLVDGSTIRLRPERKNHVWSDDFVSDQTYNGRKYQVLNIIAEYTRECLACHVARSITANDVLLVLSQLFFKHGVPRHLRSENGPEFVAEHLRAWIADLNVECSFITPGSPSENGYVESLNGRMRAELLDGEILYKFEEAKVLIERWRHFYNFVRPHSSQGSQPPAPIAHWRYRSSDCSSELA